MSTGTAEGASTRCQINLVSDQRGERQPETDILRRHPEALQSETVYAIACKTRVLIRVPGIRLRQRPESRTIPFQLGGRQR